jgi:hypothetical protein
MADRQNFSTKTMSAFLQLHLPKGRKAGAPTATAIYVPFCELTMGSKSVAGRNSVCSMPIVVASINDLPCGSLTENRHDNHYPRQTTSVIIVW